MKRLYKGHLSQEIELEYADGNEDEEEEKKEKERDNRRDWCVRVFLLVLIGCTILADKSNKRINLIWLDAMRDPSRIYEWSSGGMTLTNIYHSFSEAIDPATGSIGGY